MLLLIIFILACYGATNIMVFGSIFSGWRQFWLYISPKYLGKLFTCPMCLGPWWGFIISYIFIINGVLTPVTQLGFPIAGAWFWVAIFVDGLIGGAGVWLLHTLQEYFENE